jgi:hypothetical protein
MSANITVGIAGAANADLFLSEILALNAELRSKIMDGIGLVIAFIYHNW